MFFTFQRVIFSLSSAFREFTGDVIPLHTHTHAQTHTFIKHMQYKKSSLLLDISNLNKTKGLSGNQALIKIQVTVKKQKTSSIQFRTGKKYFFRDI